MRTVILVSLKYNYCCNPPKMTAHIDSHCLMVRLYTPEVAPPGRLQGFARLVGELVGKIEGLVLGPLDLFQQLIITIDCEGDGSQR